MKLLTHNLLICNKKACAKGGNNFPLKLVAKDTKKTEIEYNKELLIRLIDRLDWNALVQTVESVSSNSIKNSD
jgi:multifunctional methyltransferase subunit TRM112